MSDLEAALGYTFADPALLEQALTHRSYAHEHGGADNERLEFLGDAVLQLAASQILLERYPTQREGPLTSLRQNIVSESALAAVGRRIGVTDRLRLGRGSMKTGDAQRDSIVANTVEAVLGAVFVEAGIEPCRTIVGGWFDDTLAALDARAAQGGGSTTWKHPWNRLQELTQERWRVGPTWRETGRDGEPGAQVFTVAIDLGELTIAVGQGRSQSEARTRAAEGALERVSKVRDLAALAPGEDTS